MRNIFTSTLFFLSSVFFAVPVFGVEPIHVGLWHSDLSQKGPGVMIKKIQDDNLLAPLESGLSKKDLDILVLLNIDQDDEAWGLSLIAQKLGYPYYFHAANNRGIYSGADLDEDGLIGPHDAYGFGYFRGQGGMGIFAKDPITVQHIFTQTPRSDFAPPEPRAGYPPDLPLWSSGVWWVQVHEIDLIVTHLTTPALDGALDENGKRNAAELGALVHFFKGGMLVDDQNMPTQPPLEDYVLAATLNTDPNKGDGPQALMQAFLEQNILQDPKPIGDLGEKTVEWAQTGPMRVDYILPSLALEVKDQGQITIQNAPHRLIWVTLETK